MLVQDVLDLELKGTHKDGRPPNRLVVHRRGVRPAQGVEDSLTYELHCTSRTSQVSCAPCMRSPAYMPDAMCWACMYLGPCSCKQRKHLHT